MPQKLEYEMKLWESIILHILHLSLLNSESTKYYLGFYVKDFFCMSKNTRYCDFPWICSECRSNAYFLVIFSLTYTFKKKKQH